MKSTCKDTLSSFWFLCDAPFVEVHRRILTICFGCSYTWLTWSKFVEAFGVSLAWSKKCRTIIEEVLRFLPVMEKGKFLWKACFFALHWGIWLGGIVGFLEVRRDHYQKGRCGRLLIK